VSSLLLEATEFSMKRRTAGIILAVSVLVIDALVGHAGTALAAAVTGGFCGTCESTHLACIGVGNY
jgi:hypothetical protein